MKEKTILEDFIGEICSGCGKSKISRQSFCRRCYRSLHREMQSALWKRFGEGYEEAFMAARDILVLFAKDRRSLFDS